MELIKSLHKIWLNIKMTLMGMRWVRLVYSLAFLGLFLFFVFRLNSKQSQVVPYETTGTQKQQQQQQQQQQPCSNSTSYKPFSFVAYGRGVDSGHLRHVFELLDEYGYRRVNKVEDDWDVMWSHDYPFQKLSTIMRNLKPHQKVNHFPGTGFITNKMDLATSGLKSIPKAFKIPEQKNLLLSYAAENPSKKFVQKSNDHRGIKIRSLSEVDLDAPGTFIQEFVDNPLLVDGYKFDIGIYTTITSFDPLRVYVYEGDALFRYCPEKYYPFDPHNLNKYVIGDDYLPTWEVPSLKKFYVEQGFSMKDSFNGYMISQGRDPQTIWEQIEEAIRQICLSKEAQIIKYVNLYKSKRNFFEMMRFDFVVDNNLNVFIMEVNMSPNLSSAHFLQNQLLYEQVLYNMFSLVGLGTRGFNEKEQFLVSEKNLMVSPSTCVKCSNCMAPECQLCKPCLSGQTRRILKDAYIEHMNSKDFKRVFPVTDKKFLFEDQLGPENRLMVTWYQQKCQADVSWCS